jgi:CubicO group peptidase (beta-lactamase class C family)
VDNKVLSGIVLGFLIVVVAGAFLVFNPLKSDNSPDNGMVGSVNQTGNNTTNNTGILPSNSLITFIPLSSGFNIQSSSISPPNSGPPVTDPLDHIISLFDAYVNSIFPESGIPGSAIVIVKGDKVVYMNCLGVKNLASGEPVSPNTLFEIGSCSKAFTATNIAQLVSNGTLSWDDPISKYFPDISEFQMYDSEVTGKLTIRDCLSHRSGQPAYSQDTEWMMFNDSYSRMLYNLRYVKNDTPFNTTYAYNNIIYALAGYYASRATGITWSELIKEDLLNPLGMTSSTATVKDFFNSPDHATPYKLLSNGTLVPYHTASIDEVGPAGVLGCSISEMANWLKFQIADTGMYNGVQIVSKEDLDETRTGQIKYTDTIQYAMGWLVNDQLITHAGDTISSQTSVSVFLKEGIGIVSVTNAGPIGQDFNSAILAKLSLLLKGNEVTDPWIDYGYKDQHKPAPFPDPVPPLVGPQALDTYTGVYSNDFYGNITITVENNVLKCYYGYNTQSNDLKHWNDSVFLDPIFDMPLEFKDIHDGSAHQLETSVQNYTTTPPGTSVFNRTES